MKKANILITDKFDKDLLEKYSKKYDISYYPQIDVTDLPFIIHKFNIIIISTRISFNNKLIEKARNLKLIIRMGAGVDHIDLNACKKNKVTVCNTPNSNVASVVEYVFGQLIEYNRKLRSMHNNVLNGKFRNDLEPGHELRDKTLGIIGVGRIGSKIALIGNALEMNVLGNDPYLSKSKKKQLPIKKWLSLKKLLEKSDIVTLHVPLTEETNHMVNNDFLDNMKDGSILVNTSRGKVLKFDDVKKYAKTGKIRNFIIDVFETEPFRPKLPKTIEKYFTLSPHTAAFTKESHYNRSKEAFEEVEEFINKKKPHGKIDLKRGY